MPFAIITQDKDGHAHVRNAHQDAHKRYLDEHKHLLLAAGAMLDDDGETAHGGILLVDVETREEAEIFVRNDPFRTAGLFGDVKITRWRKAFFDSERLVPLSPD